MHKHAAFRNDAMQYRAVKRMAPRGEAHRIVLNTYTFSRHPATRSKRHCTTA